MKNHNTVVVGGHLHPFQCPVVLVSRCPGVPVVQCPGVIVSQSPEEGGQGGETYKGGTKKPTMGGDGEMHTFVTDTQTDRHTDRGS